MPRSDRNRPLGFSQIRPVQFFARSSLRCGQATPRARSNWRRFPQGEAGHWMSPSSTIPEGPQSPGRGTLEQYRAALSCAADRQVHRAEGPSVRTCHAPARQAGAQACLSVTGCLRDDPVMHRFSTSIRQCPPWAESGHSRFGQTSAQRIACNLFVMGAVAGEAAFEQDELGDVERR
jgi:hypothetical protein